MFCEEIESHPNNNLEQDIAERLGYEELFKNYKGGFLGKDATRGERTRWILDKWIAREGERASVQGLKIGLSSLKETHRVFKKLEAFSKPW